VSRQVADTAQAAWQQTHRHRPVVRRDLGANPVPTDAWALAVSATSTPEAEQIEAQRRARELAATLVDELAAADAYLFAVPLYNYGVSQHFKVWSTSSSPTPAWRRATNSCSPDARRRW
jgi:FMN-dependent NADH-azoreductase